MYNYYLLSNNQLIVCLLFFLHSSFYEAHVFNLNLQSYQTANQEDLFKDIVQFNF